VIATRHCLHHSDRPRANVCTVPCHLCLFSQTLAFRSTFLAASLTCSCARRNQTSAICSRAAWFSGPFSGARYLHAFLREATIANMLPASGAASTLQRGAFRTPVTLADARRCRPTQFSFLHKTHSSDRHHIARAMAELGSSLSIIPHMRSKLSPAHAGFAAAADRARRFGRAR
jgi:hypothetical protein